jgi:DNA-directed RNA polymerase specialized sigma24 family protein
MADTTKHQAEVLRRAKVAHEEHMSMKASAAKVSHARTAALLEAYRAGVNISELAHALGVSTESISKALGRPRLGARALAAKEPAEQA